MPAFLLKSIRWARLSNVWYDIRPLNAVEASANIRYATTAPERMSASARPLHRNRPLNASLIVLVIATGLLWRSGLLPLSPILAKYGGDSLWALLVFLCFGFAWRRASTARIGWAALCFAWSIEFLQIYHALWIDSIRSTRLGHLVLGSSFNRPDLVAYAVGIAFGVLAERLLRQSRKRDIL